MRAWWSRIPRDARVAAALAILVLLQTVALAAFGLKAARSQRAEAEQGLRTLAALALARGLSEPALESLARAETAVADACARGTGPEAAAAPLQPPVFRRGFAILPDDSVVDGSGVVVVAPRAAPAAEDAALRARLSALAALAERDGGAGDAAREALAAGEATADPLAGARALRLAARAALAAGEDTLALRACERLLDRWPDAAVEGEYPFGAGAAAAAAEVWRRRAEARAPGAGTGFVEAVLAWRRALVRAPFAPSTGASEAADARRAAEAAAELLAPAERAHLREGLDALDRSDRDADVVRSPAVRDAIRAAAAAGGPRWVEAAAPDGRPLSFCVAAGAAGSVVAFQADAESVRASILRPLLADFAVHEGVAVRALAPDGRPLDGDPAPEPGRAVLASLPIPLPAGAVVAEAFLSDPALLDREAARARNLVLGLFAAAALALGLGSLLVLRMVRSEVRLAQMKADFVSGVSHDLKTPLTSIRMFVETLRDGRAPTEEARRECLDVVDREAKRLERLVHRVLKFSRLSAGTRPLRREECDPAEVAREAAQVFRGRLGDEPCEFRLEAPDALPPVSLDRDAATQALLDLLENARKYTPAGSKRILLRAAAGPAGGARWEVEDNGPGIPSVERERVFEEFYRLPGAAGEDAEGAGLGLALVKRIAEAHGGSVRVEEAGGGGSRFVLDLPAAPPAREGA